MTQEPISPSDDNSPIMADTSAQTTTGNTVAEPELRPWTAEVRRETGSLSDAQKEMSDWKNALKDMHDNTVAQAEQLQQLTAQLDALRQEQKTHSPMNAQKVVQVIVTGDVEGNQVAFGGVNSKEQADKPQAQPSINQIVRDELDKYFKIIFPSSPPETPAEEIDIWASPEAVQQWFELTLSTTEERFFVVALALFNGQSQTDIMDAVHYLHSTLQQDNQENNFTYNTGFDVFSSPMPRLISSAKATYVDTSEINNTGQVIIKHGIAFLDPRAAFQVLYMLCRYYHNIAKRILLFLKDVVEKSDRAPIRYHASLTIALIGQTQFNWVKESILDPWSKSFFFNTLLRYAVSNILSLIYNSADEYKLNVYRLLNSWASGGNRSMQKTAAICCGYITELQLEQKLSLLTVLLKKDDMLLLDTLVATTVYVYRDENPEGALKVLEQFVDWATQKDNDALQVGSQLVSLGLMAVLLSEDFRDLLPKQANGYKVELWNLISHCESDFESFCTRHRRALRKLFTAYLEMPPIIAREARQRLEDLACFANDQDSYRPTIKYLFLDLCCHPDSKSRGHLVWQWLQLWGQAPNLRNKPYISEIERFVRQKCPNLR